MVMIVIELNIGTARNKISKLTEILFGVISFCIEVN